MIINSTCFGINKKGKVVILYSSTKPEDLHQGATRQYAIKTPKGKIKLIEKYQFEKMRHSFLAKAKYYGKK